MHFVLCFVTGYVLHFGEIAQKIKKVHYYYYSMDSVKYKTKYKFLTSDLPGCLTITIVELRWAFCTGSQPLGTLTLHLIM